MANAQAIKGRIKSVKNTRQITKAMEMVAASKMRRAQQSTLASRPYFNTAREVLTRLSESIDVSQHELMKPKPAVKTKLYVVITSDRGLAGAYNANVLRRFGQAAQSDMARGEQVKAITIGAKASKLVARLDQIESIGSYDKFPDRPAESDISPILSTLLDGFLQDDFDQVHVVYTDFKSSISQEVSQLQLLPASFAPAESPQDLDDIIFEPSPRQVLNSIVPRLVEAQFFQMIKESQASEHSMRMMAMKNASDNAGDVIDDLTLEFNSARQAKITQEIAEITGGSEALK